MTTPANRFDEIPELALIWHEAGRRIAIATVVETWGSAPRPTGSQMLVSEDGAIEGSVSGGCVEGAVVIAAQEAMSDGKCRLLVFGVSGEDAFSAGLACGGEIKVLVTPVGADFGAGQGMPIALLHGLVDARKARRTVVYQLDLTSWRHQLIHGDTAQTGLASGCFHHLHQPPLRLIIAGAVHVAQALIPMAQLAGYDVHLIDPRAAFATEARFPDVTIHADFPDEVMPALKLDGQTAVVTLAHDPKIDDPALEAGLNSKVFYIGALGSRRTQGQRLERLAARGFGPDALRRIHGPVGLDIGAIGPAEIAVSIIAELVAVRRGRQ